MNSIKHEKYNHILLYYWHFGHMLTVSVAVGSVNNMKLALNIRMVCKYPVLR